MVLIRECKLCRKLQDIKELERHHLIPKSIGGTDLDGRCNLHKKCHQIIHNKLLSVAFFAVNKEGKEKIIKAIKYFNKKVLGKENKINA
jgi:hypothetical protein